MGPEVGESLSRAEVKEGTNWECVVNFTNPEIQRKGNRLKCLPCIFHI